MDTKDKLTDANQVLQYLAQQFPECFILKGQAKPLKVGLFNDLAERLQDDACVSKTQLRVAIRRYTSSWRYLKSIQKGVQRVDLDGNPCGFLEDEHVVFAQEKLKESQEKFKKQKQTETAQAKVKRPKKIKNTKQQQNKAPRKPKQESHQPASLDELKVEQRVKVKLGTKPVLGRILELNKDEVSVQLDTGLTVKVMLHHIML